MHDGDVARALVDRVLLEVERASDEIVDFTSGMIRIPTVNPPGEHYRDICNLIANRRLDHWTRVVIDVEGYRTRREESLIGLAERVARQVSRSRRPIVLEPMPPNERRIVHLTLRGNPEVTTQSTGEGSARRVTVQPRV